LILLCFPSKEGNNGIYFLIYKMLLIKSILTLNNFINKKRVLTNQIYCFIV